MKLIAHSIPFALVTVWLFIEVGRSSQRRRKP